MVKLHDRSTFKINCQINRGFPHGFPQFYLSKHALQQLGAIVEEFPTEHAPKKPDLAGVKAICGFPRHKKPPSLPNKHSVSYHSWKCLAHETMDPR